MDYRLVYNSNSVSPEPAARLRAMPKVEIHVHLEGATEADLIYRMAQRNGVDLPAATLDATFLTAAPKSGLRRRFDAFYPPP